MPNDPNDPKAKGAKPTRQFFRRARPEEIERQKKKELIDWYLKLEKQRRLKREGRGDEAN